VPKQFTNWWNRFVSGFHQTCPPKFTNIGGRAFQRLDLSFNVGEIKLGDGKFGTFGGNAVNRTRLSGIPCAMTADPCIEPIGNIDRTVRADANIARSK